MLINPKQYTLDANERSRMQSALDKAIQWHQKSMKNCNPELPAYSNNEMAIANLLDLKEKLDN